MEQNSKLYPYQNVELREEMKKSREDAQEASKDYVPFRDRKKKMVLQFRVD